MKTSFIKSMAMASGLASLTAFSVVPAMADHHTDPSPAEQSFQSTKTRAEVHAEYLQAVKDGTLPNISETGETFLTRPMSAKAPASNLTREAVHADTIEWLRLHRGDVQMGSQ